jgi:hypothetical protein
MKPEVRSMVDALRHNARQYLDDHKAYTCMMNAADQIVLMDCRMQEACNYIRRGMPIESSAELLEKSVDVSVKE